MLDKPGHRADKVRSYNNNRKPSTPETHAAKSNLRRSAKRADNRA